MRDTYENYRKRWPPPEGWRAPALGNAALLVVDGNYVLQSIIRGASAAFEGVQGDERVPIGCAGFLAAVAGALSAFPTIRRIIVAWDTGIDPWRAALFPGYKQGRKKRREEDTIDYQAIVYDAQKCLQKALPDLFVEQIGGMPSKRVEADDLIALVCESAKQAPLLSSVLILSSDQDLTQLCTPQGARVPVYFCPRAAYETVGYDEERRGVSPAMNLIDDARVRARFGCSAAQIPLYKAIVGDASDSLPGVPGLGEKSVRAVGAEYGGNLAEAVVDACMCGMGDEKAQGRFKRAFGKLGAEQRKLFRNVTRLATLTPPPLSNILFLPPAPFREVALHRDAAALGVSKVFPLPRSADQQKILRSIATTFNAYMGAHAQYMRRRGGV